MNSKYNREPTIGEKLDALNLTSRDKLDNPTFEKILKDVFIVKGKNSDNHAFLDGLDFHYKDMTIPFGQIKLLRGNMDKIHLKPFRWYTLKNLGLLINKIESFQITKAKLTNNSRVLSRFNKIKNKAKVLKGNILDAAGPRASNEYLITAAIFDLAIKNLAKLEVENTCKDIIFDIENFWQEEIFLEYQNTRNYFLKENILCTTGQNWVSEIENIREMLIYNNLTNEHKFLEIANNKVFEHKNGQKIKTNWQNIIFADGTQLGKGPEEIYLILKTIDKNNYSQRRQEKSEIYSSACDL
jgi:hypothetical protein